MARHRRFRRGIYLLPTLFTIGNLLCGFSSIVWTSQGVLAWAALLIVFAGILDGLDGRIARMTRSTSEFGVQFDSLADIVSFGIAPAFLIYHWGLRPLNRVGWLIAFLYVICAAMRLARFNIRPAGDKRFFVGLPSPPAAGVLACTVYALPVPPQRTGASWLVAVLVVVAALLMTSRFRYRSFKDFDLQHRRPYLYVLPLAGVIVAILIDPPVALFVLAMAYLVSAPVLWLVAWAIRRSRGTGTRDLGGSEVGR